jgi:hypothetical protein
VVRSPQDVADLLMAEMGLLDQEHVRVVLLSTKNVVISPANGAIYGPRGRIPKLIQHCYNKNG